MKRVLVLGSYGLAGRATVAALRRAGISEVVASGRRADRLASRCGPASATPCETLVLDALDPGALRAACESSAVVINCVGPYDRGGAQIAETVLETGSHYVDCANEQVHGERLRALDGLARESDALLVTGAGLIPGLSTLLTAHLLDRVRDPTGVEIVYAQLRHAYEDGGLASLMGGVLDAVHRPRAVHRGQPLPVALGQSTRRDLLPEPFGQRRLLEVPTLEVPVLAARYDLEEIHTWFALGQQPGWLFGVIRLLDPSTRSWAYRLLERLVEAIRRREHAAAERKGLGMDAILIVRASTPRGSREENVRFTDGATPTGVLPARIARDLVEGRIALRGFLTPLDLYTWSELCDDLAPCILGTSSGACREG